MKKLKKTIFGLILCVAAVSFFYFLIAGAESITAQSDSGPSFSIEKIRYISGLNPNFEFLDSDSFSSLRVNGDIPIDPQIEGRDNPFIAY